MSSVQSTKRNRASRRVHGAARGCMGVTGTRGSGAVPLLRRGPATGGIGTDPAEREDPF